MDKYYIRDINDNAKLYRDNNGIAWIKDNKAGVIHSCHANIHKTGSVRGMKNLGYWNKKDRVIPSYGYKYNIDSFIVDTNDELDNIVAKESMCAACIERRNK